MKNCSGDSTSSWVRPAASRRARRIEPGYRLVSGLSRPCPNEKNVLRLQSWSANGPSASCSSANMAATWRLVVPSMRVSAHRCSQRSRSAGASSRRSKRRPRGVFFTWPTPASTLPFAIGVADATRQGDDPVVGENILIERIQRRVVDVGREDAFAHDDTGTSPPIYHRTDGGREQI